MFRQKVTRRQNGAVLIHVAFALIALLAFTSFVVDYGIMWISRRQAQNVADGAALAGAIALLQDGGSPESAERSAQHFAAANPVWGQGNSPANVQVALSGPGVDIPPCGTTPGCVRVDVFRKMPDRAGVTRGNPIPTFFSHLVGIGDQGVRATATAQTASGNNVRCLLPFAAIDRWSDSYDDNPDPEWFANDPITDPGVDGWSPNDHFQRADGDTYIPPYHGNTNHTGWKTTTDYGRQLIIKAGSLNDKVYSSGWALQVDLPNSTGSSDYNWNIENCNEQPVGIAEEPETCPTVNEEIGCISIKTGMAQGPTKDGIVDVVAYDPAAHWDWTADGPNGPGTGAIVGGQGMSTPRLRPMVILDIEHYMAQGCSGTTCIGKIANIIGFFVEGMCKDVTLDPGMKCENPSKDVVGRIVELPGSFATGVGTVEDSAAFIQIIRLVR